MNLRVFRSAEEAGQAVATAVAAQLARKPTSVIGLPTGRTSLTVYEALVALHQTGQADFSQAHTFNIDEFVGVPSSDKRSYCAFMQKHLFTRINLPASHIHFLNGGATSHEAECARFEREIASLGGMDLLLVGIGGNAHIGFNEPGSGGRSRTRLVTLDTITRRDAAADFFGEDSVPREALTMGVATILEAREIAILATGEHKADIVRRAVEGPVDTEVAATFLQRHPRTTFYLDEAAAADLIEPEGKWTQGVYFRDEQGREAYMRVCAADHPDAEPSVSRYRTRAAAPDAALLELDPQTGRMHQLRVHVAAIGRPIDLRTLRVLGGRLLPVGLELLADHVEAGVEREAVLAEGESATSGEHRSDRSHRGFGR